MTLVERLGFGPDQAVLLITADDIGFVHGVNRAFIHGLDDGVVQSGSVMVVCPWFAEVASFAASRPTVDLGVHLTLTCETSPYRWGPVLGPLVPSLVREDGSFPETEAEVAAQADVSEVERELRAQVGVARRAGLQLTHLSSHMGTLYHRLDYFEAYQRVAIEEGLPIRYPPPWFRDERIEQQSRVHEAELPRIENVVSPSEDVASDEWLDFYVRAVEDLPPGVTELVFHPGYDDEEMRAAYAGMEGWGAAWRQRDIDVACHPMLREAIQRRGAVVIGWASIAELMGR
jgi:chitin disaccharide deacetylase